MRRRPFDAACAVEAAAIRAEPDDGSEQLTQALRGEPLWVEERAGAWARVRTFYDYPGWIRRESLAGAPEAWELRTGGSEPLDEARKYAGTPYEWGGLSERGIDCSGLVHMAFRHAGLVVPRDAQEQEEAGTAVDAPEPGDLVTYGDASADHIAFWVGNGRILHATGREGADGVVEEPEPPSLGARRRRFVRLGLPPKRYPS